ncbi:hypothetical protein PM082_007474 [Marasmius tenuissimus]|nr:hypothetical protein PM082_007474 [Marasmius tenuissimus]
MSSNDSPELQGWNSYNGDPNATSFLDHNHASSPSTEDAYQFRTSSTFGLTDADSIRPPPNLVLISSDLVLFHVDETTLVDKSTDSFKNLLPLPTEDSSRSLFMGDIPSTELEIMLRAIYDVESNVLPSTMQIATLIRAIDRLKTFGVQPSACITQGSHLYRYLLACATTHPLEVYATAAHHNIASLAVTVSSHTLVLDLSELDDSLCTRMGAIYLLRLFQLHTARLETLKKLLSGDLGLHNPNPVCNFEGQKVFKGMWNLAVAEMFPTLRPSTTTSTIRTTILSHTTGIKCEDCAKLRDTRLARVIGEWTMTSRNITL